MSPITRALGSGVERLKRESPGAEAAPAFLPRFTTQRERRRSAARLGNDNRWIALPQDFPRARCSQAAGSGLQR